MLQFALLPRIHAFSGHLLNILQEGFKLEQELITGEGDAALWAALRSGLGAGRQVKCGHHAWDSLNAWLPLASVRSVPAAGEN